MLAAALAAVRADGWKFLVFELSCRTQPNGPRLYDRSRAFSFATHNVREPSREENAMPTVEGGCLCRALPL